MSSPSATTIASNGARVLQEKLHELLTRLAATIELVKNWPESEGDDASIHVETTTKLIASIKAVISSVQNVDGVVKGDPVLKKTLQDCLIPLDLLDLLDHAGGLNPDCFSRALLRESLGQLAGLKRRKLALEMLGAAVNAGLIKREALDAARGPSTTLSGNDITGEGGIKRKLIEEEDGSAAAVVKAEDTADEQQPKKQKIG